MPAAVPGAIPMMPMMPVPGMPVPPGFPQMPFVQPMPGKEIVEDLASGKYLDQGVSLNNRMCSQSQVF